jgi:histidinol dehydrogenase
VLVSGPEQALDATNAIAPEHLQLMCADADVLVPLVRHAGAVFVGPWASAVIGDYVAGVNHVLPTGGTARFSSALRVADFQKHVHVVSLDQPALERVAPFAIVLAEAEGLAAHAQALRLREGKR